MASETGPRLSLGGFVLDKLKNNLRIFCAETHTKIRVFFELSSSRPILLAVSRRPFGENARPKRLMIGYYESARTGDKPALNCELGRSDCSTIRSRCEDAAVSIRNPCGVGGEYSLTYLRGEASVSSTTNDGRTTSMSLGMDRGMVVSMLFASGFASLLTKNDLEMR